METGTEFSHYRLRERIGRGGMGEVFLAEDTTLKRRVALKFLPADVAGDRAARRRLIHEARAAAALDHPFICKIYETGERDGEPFIAMEYVDGHTLLQRMATCPLPVDDALRIAGEIGEALKHAHAHGIIHRDLKPANVMVTADGHVKVMDFGLAKRLPTGSQATDETISAVATESGMTPGTLAYMSPEQVMGQPLDARSDIFAFGIVLYEMLAVRHPFKKESAGATLNAIVSEPPGSALRPGVPEHVRQGLDRMLAKNRDARYPDIGAALSDLRSGVARTAPRKGVRDRRIGWRRIVPLAVAALLVVALAAAIAMFVSRRQPALAFNARDWIVVADFENQTGDRQLDRALDRALAVGIQQSRYVNTLPRSRVDGALTRMGRTGVRNVDEAAAREVAVREGAKAVLACSIAKVGDSYDLTARLIDPATHNTVLTESARAENKNGILGALDQLTTAVRRNLGESLASIARRRTGLPQATTASLEALNAYVNAFQMGENQHQMAVRLLEQAVSLDPNFAMAHAELARLYYLVGDRARGEAHFEKALGLLDRLTLRERLWIQALAEDTRGNREAAVSAFRAYLTEYPDDSVAWFRLGWTLMAALARPDEAIEAFKRSIALDKWSSGAYVNTATCYTLLGRDAESLSYYQKSFDLSPANLTGAWVNNEYGFTLVRLGRVAEARDVFQKMVDQADLAKQATGLRSIALLEMFQGRYGKAAEDLRKAVLMTQATKAIVSELRNRTFLVGIYRMLGRDRDASRELTASARLAYANRIDPAWLVRVGAFYARDGSLREAGRMLARASDTSTDVLAASSVNRSSTGDQASVSVMKGDIELAAGRAGEALARFDLALRLQPKNTETMVRVARALAALGRWPEAREKYEAILAARDVKGTEAQEVWVVSHLELGRVCERMGDAPKAREYYERLLTIWKDGDPELRALIEAKKQLTALGRAAA